MAKLKRPIQPMPKFVIEALKKEGLEKAYENRPPYQRNDYLGWINNAKKIETKERRLSIMLSELRQGFGYMGMDWNA